ncbi:MAG: hypothetical protein JXA21_27875 [Anaerolineae bacterium]|nr:hypothetical protein [Anaerolineae bacterium]
MDHLNSVDDQKRFTRLMIVLAILGSIVWALLIWALVARAQSSLPPLESMGAVRLEAAILLVMMGVIRRS